ncbi:hypothetical protein BV394_12815 [Brevirhabdus pacifica]|uniref:Uncharacterized protein n=1 Tax=Brevirhabdus pacifica TaxID=1267768 RepID=A0A1U7DKU7_9RHOB|nr:hypothetical protein BV394_12815 [Brevirhabdus pacifica]PJJ85391.1 uncharacterized protein DUF3306 [Brevirhabdus pacifica]
MSARGNFWSRRKAAVRAEEQAAARAEQELREARELAELESTQAEKTDEELLEELGLPDPDTLGKGADFAAFMARSVPDRLRRRALRRLWLSDPVLANLDDLVDYADDYTDAATCVENLQTAYQVGRGMTRHVEAMEAKARALADALENPQDGDEGTKVADAASAEGSESSSSLRLPEAGSRTAAHGSAENARARGLAPETEMEDAAQEMAEGDSPEDIDDETADAMAELRPRDAYTHDDEGMSPAPRRHMRFSFAETASPADAHSSKGRF